MEELLELALEGVRGVQQAVALGGVGLPACVEGLQQLVLSAADLLLELRGARLVAVLQLARLLLDAANELVDMLQLDLLVCCSATPSTRTPRARIPSCE